LVLSASQFTLFGPCGALPLRLPPGTWQPVTAKTNLRAGGVLRDPNVLFVVSLAALAHRRRRRRRRRIRYARTGLLRASWRYLEIVGPPSPTSSDGSTILEGAARSAPPALYFRRKTASSPGGGGMHWLPRTTAPAFGAATRYCMPGDSAP
jgi:hypothetical protein